MPAIDVTTLTEGDLVKGWTFAEAPAGRLQVLFQAQWTGAWTDDIVLRAFIGTGSGRLHGLVSATGATQRFELPYAGAYAALAVGFEFVSYHYMGPVTLIKMDQLLVTCRLIQGG
jgi:hypothetical protein